MTRSIASGSVSSDSVTGSRGPPAGPRRVRARTSGWGSSDGSTSSHVRHVSVKPCRHTSGDPEPPRNEGVKTNDTPPNLSSIAVGSTLIALVMAPALVGVSTVVARRWGERAGGVLSAFPAIVGPVLLIVALAHGARFAAPAANATLLGLVSLAPFAVPYGRRAPGRGWRSSLLAGWACAALAGLAVGLAAGGAGSPAGALIAAPAVAPAWRGVPACRPGAAPPGP